MVSSEFSRSICDRAVRVSAYGTSRNWSFAGEDAHEIESKNPGITEDLRRVLESHNVVRALSPKPVFSASVAVPDQLTSERLPNVFRGADADGVVLEKPGDAYLLTSADCLCTILRDPQRGTTIATHCGRDALIDRGFLEGKPPRERHSIIDAAMDVMVARGWEQGNRLDAFLTVGIGPVQFTHFTTPTVWNAQGKEEMNPHVKVNRSLISFLMATYNRIGHGVVMNVDSGAINLVRLVKAQLARWGVSTETIRWDGIDTAMDTRDDGTYKFHSNRRGDTSRNLVLVQRL